MKRLAWICMSLALGCGGNEGKPASGAKENAGRASRDGGQRAGSDEGPPAAGSMREDGGGVPSSAAPSSGAGPSTGVRVNGLVNDAGVGGDQILSKLSPVQLESLCRAQVAALLTAVTLEDECTLDAVFETDDPRACKKQVSECVAEGRETKHDDERAAVGDCMAGLVKCPYTVDALQRCVDEEHAEWSRISRAYACDQSGGRQFSRDLEPRISDECQKLQSSCYSL